MTLQSSGGELTLLDRTEPLGEPGETIFATRFMGDRAYVVTFQNTDPLYAVDLSEPNDLAVLGELHIPGFSDYIHPMGTDTLLTIGMDGEGDWLSAVTLQIFDVADPTSPTLQHKESFGEDSYSIANQNHKAFTFVDDYFGAGEHLVLFPIVAYEPEYLSGLEVVRVSVAGGITRLGRIDHTSLLTSGCDDMLEGEPCFYYSGEEMRRGVQVGDYVYAVSHGGITVHPLKEFSGDPIATIEMAPAEFSSCGYDVPFIDDVDVSDDEPSPVEMGGSAGF
jgi:hypothetical protein